MDSFRSEPSGKYYLAWKPTEVCYDAIILVDRSGSTSDFSDVIMENTIMLVESLIRHKKNRVAIIDTKGNGRVVMEFGTFDKTWFEPQSEDGTPLEGMLEAAVKMRLKNRGILIIMTDGEAELSGLNRSMFNKFTHILPYFIGSSIPNEYKTLFPECKAVDPGTLIEMTWELLK
jgi:predicted metal-dependent peptidase